MQGSLEDLAGEAPLFIALESYFKQVRGTAEHRDFELTI